MSTVIAISDKSRSAVVALTELARRGDGGPVPIVEISEARDIPLHVLEQLFAALRRVAFWPASEASRAVIHSSARLPT